MVGPSIKSISELKSANPLNNADLFVVEQRVGGMRKVTYGILRQGLTGEGGSGRQISLRKSNGYIQWQAAGDPTWTDLVSLEELQGPPGSGSLSQQVFTGDGVKKIFNGISGIISADALKCVVTVGGATQQPNTSYTVSTEDGGSVIFDEAPPNNLAITVCVFQ